MAESVRIEQGATIMPRVGNEPLAMVAPTLSMSCTWFARERSRTSASGPTSWASVSSAARRDDQMHIGAALIQEFDDAQPDGRAGRAADADDDARLHRNLNPAVICGQSASTRALTSGVMASFTPHSRSVSAPILLVASMPSLPPSPDSGEAKSR